MFSRPEPDDVVPPGAWRWEYKSVRYLGPGNPDPQFNELGQQGWELVAAVNVSSGGRDSVNIFTFKRPRP